MGPDIKLLASSLLQVVEVDSNWRVFIDFVSDQIFSCFPSSTETKVSQISQVFLKSLNTLMSGSERDECLQKMLACGAAASSPTVQQHFLNKFVEKLSFNLEEFIIKSMNNPSLFNFEEVSSCDDMEPDLNVKQTVHYVGGCVVRKILKRASQSTAPDWQDIKAVTLSRFVTGSLADAPPDEIGAWTAVRDRGGLKHISHSVWVYLMGVSGVLKAAEEDDGSVLHARVWSLVRKDEGLQSLWSDCVGDLNCAASEILQELVVTTFSNTWGQGVRMRRMNQLVVKASNNVSLRGGLAGRSK